MSNFPNSNLYGYGFQQSSQQMNYPPPTAYYNGYFNNNETENAEKSWKHEPFYQVKKKQDENASNLKAGYAIRKCRARYGLEKKHEWCKACCQKKKCSRYKNDEESMNIVSPENTINYSAYGNNVYKQYVVPMINVMLGY